MTKDFTAAANFYGGPARETCKANPCMRAFSAELIGTASSGLSKLCAELRENKWNAQLLHVRTPAQMSTRLGAGGGGEHGPVTPSPLSHDAVMSKELQSQGRCGIWILLHCVQLNLHLGMWRGMLRVLEGLVRASALSAALMEASTKGPRPAPRTITLGNSRMQSHHHPWENQR